MLYMGAICAVMRGSGIAESSAALVTHILNTPGCLGVSLNCLRALHEMLREGQCDTYVVLQ